MTWSQTTPFFSPPPPPPPPPGVFRVHLKAAAKDAEDAMKSSCHRRSEKTTRKIKIVTRSLCLFSLLLNKKRDLFPKCYYLITYFIEISLSTIVYTLFSE